MSQNFQSCNLAIAKYDATVSQPVRPWSASRSGTMELCSSAAALISRTLRP